MNLCVLMYFSINICLRQYLFQNPLQSNECVEEFWWRGRFSSYFPSCNFENHSTLDFRIGYMGKWVKLGITEIPSHLVCQLRAVCTRFKWPGWRCWRDYITWWSGSYKRANTLHDYMEHKHARRKQRSGFGIPRPIHLGLSYENSISCYLNDFPSRQCTLVFIISFMGIVAPFGEIVSLQYSRDWDYNFGYREIIQTFDVYTRGCWQNKVFQDCSPPFLQLE